MKHQTCDNINLTTE